jgi:hypothetical protein
LRALDAAQSLECFLVYLFLWPCHVTTSPRDICLLLLPENHINLTLQLSCL